MEVLRDAVLRVVPDFAPPDRLAVLRLAVEARDDAALVPEEREAVAFLAVPREAVDFAVRVPVEREAVFFAAPPRLLAERDEVPDRAVLVPALRAVFVPELRAVFVPVERAVLARFAPPDALPPLAAAAVRPAAPRRVVPVFAAPEDAPEDDARRVPLLRRFGFCSVSVGWASPAAMPSSWFVSSLIFVSSCGFSGSWPQFIRLYRQRVPLTSPCGRCARWRWM